MLMSEQLWSLIAVKWTPYTGAHALSGLGRTLGLRFMKSTS
jgi:hypothetical protein